MNGNRKIALLKAKRTIALMDKIKEDRLKRLEDTMRDELRFFVFTNDDILNKCSKSEDLELHDVAKSEMKKLIRDMSNKIIEDLVKEIKLED